jgi:hypothetical protein
MRVGKTPVGDQGFDRGCRKLRVIRVLASAITLVFGEFCKKGIGGIPAW